ncbi:MAG: PEP-CTERM sorting domain-containing protein [Luteolibacter sp.]
MKTTKLLICAVAIAAAFAAVKAQGQNISATLVDISPSLAVTGTIDNGSFIEEYPSGVSHFTDFDAFCIEPNQSISYGETLVYQVQDPASLGNYDKISRLVGGYLASSRSAADAAAVQWAIWETTNETLSSPSLLDSNVRISTPISQSTATLANQYLANINTYTPVAITYLSNPNRQDVVTWNVVPEPGTAGLAALSALMMLRRRRR